MIVIANVLLMAITSIAVLLTAVLAIEIMASPTATRVRRKGVENATSRPPVAVLIPAHNEAAVINVTITGIQQQLLPGDRLVVIADNCSDDTAFIARNLGAEVVERHDLVRVGKGYALDAGIRYLNAGLLPDVVIFIDADCRFSDASIDELAQACAVENRPIQSINLVTVPAAATALQRIGAFAWRVKNKLRPLGLNALSMPCLLTGTGMAFPVHLLRQLDLATGHITEDTLIGVECALLGRPPLLAPRALVTSGFAPTDRGRDIQKSRWVHGHLSAIAELVPKLLLAGIRQRDVRLLAMAAEIAIPPLALLLIGLIALTLVAGIWYFASGYATPLALALIACALAGAALLTAWLKAGRDLIRIGELYEIARYVLRQIPIANNFAAGHRSEWTRSERGPPNHS